MICKLTRNIGKQCGYQLPDIKEMYFLNRNDLNGISTDTYDDCEYIDNVDYDDRFYKVEGTNVSYTDSLVISDYQKYREKRLTFNIVGKDDACRLNDYTMLATGRYVVLLQVEGQWILAGFANGFEADENEISTENDFRIVMTENSIVSSLPVDDSVAESIIHNEPPTPVQRVKARLYYSDGSEIIVYYPQGISIPTLYTSEIPADMRDAELESVVMDNDITAMEAGIFSGRSSLSSVQLSASLTAIPDSAFVQCISLEHIDLPSGIRSIGESAFVKTGLVEIDLPEGLLTIGDYAFDITNLVEVYVPSTVTSIGDYAFSSTPSLKRIVFISEDAPMITQNTFEQIYGNVEIYVPCDNRTYVIGNWANVDKKEEVTFQLSTGVITYTLCGYDYVDYAMVRDFIESEGMPLNNISAITVGDFVKEIREYSFDAEERMNQIKSIEIGKNVELIEDLAFYTQENIESITIYNETPPIISSLSDLIDTGGTSGDNILIFVPSGSVTTYKEADGWEDNEEQIFPIGYVAKNYFRFVALEDDCYIYHYNGADDIYYSYDGITWNLYTEDSEVTINSGESVMWKSIATEAGSFGAEGRLNVEGNVMSLIFGDDFEDKTDLTGYDSAFESLFSMIDNHHRHNPITGLTSAENLILPATTLSQGCYSSMFNGCSGLTTAPDLPATTLAERCYSSMFNGCDSLRTAPELPATTLASSCYNTMFQGCTSLITAPDLPALTLTDKCYYCMFTICRNLEYIKMLATDISATDCLKSWVEAVQTVSGTFVKSASQTSLPTGVNGIPSGWTVVDNV